MAALGTGVRRLGLAAALTAALAGCSGPPPDPARDTPDARAGASAHPVRLLGDGSTSYTGPQPALPEPVRLAPGRRPPQFVVFTWSGAVEDDRRLFSHFRQVAKDNGARMTYFLSGRDLLRGLPPGTGSGPPRRPARRGAAAPAGSTVRDTVRQLRGAWLGGNEIGTLLTGRPCRGQNGPGTAQWKAELARTRSLVRNWKTHAALPYEPALPFDFDRELTGARTRCPQGRASFLPLARGLGLRYDSSGAAGQVWPRKADGLWDLSVRRVPLPGGGLQVPATDRDFMVRQSGGPQGDPDRQAYWGDQFRDGLLQGFRRAYRGNRAPLIVGNHFEDWNGGAYTRAVEEAMRRLCPQREVRCVSLRQLADWLDAQDPELLAELRALRSGQAPPGGWARYLASRPVRTPSGAPGAPAHP
ncbi:hypothetical protein [Streptomyces sp. SCSIO ZS0520]|uniref:hypothetical protein n=1 Tax=Streptomyces sp. SCSIO ZS0520 TaxID=2892996 RepID=UPI0021D80BD6|nr:hypothetical protein [Streptomyces sp. SCSIO ZS0520]